MSESLKIPTTYADWVVCFRTLSQGDQDEELLEVITHGKVPWSSGIAGRFVGKMNDAISVRLQMAVDQFGKQIGRASGEENAIVQAILALRRQTSYLLRLVSLPVFPKELQTNFVTEIEKNISSLQEFLLNEVKKDPSGRLIRVVQHTPILVKDLTNTNPSPIPMGKSKRRIIFE